MPTGIMLRVLITFAIASSLSACGTAKSEAEAAVRNALKDPDSARFGEFYFNEKTEKGCLAVNAKNSMGGYTGDQQAYVQRTRDGWKAVEIVDLNQEFCRRVFADAAP